MKKLLLIDGNSLMFRSYYATAYTGNLMKTNDGLYTNAVFGFCNMINKLIEKESYAFVAFDAGKVTFRHKEYNEYKGTRKPLPTELKEQIPLVKEFLDIIKVKRLESLDYEADDLLATASKRFKNDFDEILVITGDHDLLQLVDGNISVGLTKKGVGELDLYTEENFYEKMNFYPWQIVEYKGIVGDTSDNLPGIKGVGEKTAIKLLNDFKNIDGIYEHLDSLTTRNRNLFIENKDSAYFCKRLATLERDANIDLSFEDIVIGKYDANELISFYTRMEFNSFIKKIKNENRSVSDFVKIESIKEELNLQGNGYITYEQVGTNYTKSLFLGIGIMIDNNNYFISEDDLLRKEVKDYFENESYLKYVFDYKGLFYILNKHNIRIKGVIFDLLLASYLINPSYSSDDFKSVGDHFMVNDLLFYENVYGANTKLHKPEDNVYKSYSLSKCNFMYQVKDIVLSLIEEKRLTNLLSLELKLSEVLASMEEVGLRLDLKKLDDIGNDLSEKQKDLEKEIYKIAGEEFNLNSPKQLGEVLFEKMLLPYPKGKKTGKNGFSTSVDVLEKLKNDYEIIKLILDYRGIAKILSTYVNGLKEVCDDNYIHPLYKQALTTTGRLSSVEPNIQNIPIRTELGQVIREVFVSRFERGIIMSADYSQIELRVLAHMSKDENMLNCFNSHTDIHTDTASKIYEIPIESVTKDMRRTAKAINFGIIYGMSAWGLSESLGISPLEANIFINKYFSRFSKAKKCLDDYISLAYKNGYSSTILGRIRYIPELQNSNGNLKQFGERTAMNSPIQGSAADIIKLAMNKVHEEMQKLKLKSLLIAQVHDELVFDVIEEEIEIMKELVKKSMENAINLDCPLEVGLAVGNNWFEAK